MRLDTSMGVRRRPLGQELAWRSAWSCCMDCRRVRSGGNRASVFLSSAPGSCHSERTEVDGATVSFEHTRGFVPLFGGGTLQG
jgi:hypothetical protein